MNIVAEKKGGKMSDSFNLLTVIKENSTAIVVGTTGMLGMALLAVGRWLGVKALDDIQVLKAKQSYSATHDDLRDCHEKISDRIENRFDKIESSILAELKDLRTRFNDHIDKH